MSDGIPTAITAKYVWSPFSTSLAREFFERLLEGPLGIFSATRKSLNLADGKKNRRVFSTGFFRFNLKVPIRERSKSSVKVYENPVADAGDESIYSK